jgi:hypothetical protein
MAAFISIMFFGVQSNSFAIILAMVVFPTPLSPINKNEWGNITLLSHFLYCILLV